jgi:AcrR family transcriptional regulator
MLDRPIRQPGPARERLLECAEAAVLAKGFAATSIEELIVAAGVTKSAFFYHFKDKGELARAILERYLERDAELLDELFGRADELSEDPLHGFLVALKMFAEMMGDLPAQHPGCLAASFAYQDQLFKPDIRALNAEGILRWRRRFGERLARIAERYPPKEPVDLDALADMLINLVEGGIIMSRAVGEGGLLTRQVLLYRDYLRRIFAG